MNEADKVTAKLMSLADNWALSAGDSAICGDESLPMQCETRAALEQAIRRAVDWGEPVAAVTAHQGLRWLVSKEEAAARGGLLGQHLYARNKP